MLLPTHNGKGCEEGTTSQHYQRGDEWFAIKNQLHNIYNNHHFAPVVPLVGRSLLALIKCSWDQGADREAVLLKVCAAGFPYGTRFIGNCYSNVITIFFFFSVFLKWYLYQELRLNSLGIPIRLTMLDNGLYVRQTSYLFFILPFSSANCSFKM